MQAEPGETTIGRSATTAWQGQELTGGREGRDTGVTEPRLATDNLEI